ncbi:hypothetical protein H5410_000317 [Solanum commersonii]|uniref:Uncharacterized protein n=1 Tax=Solanum commersonii TaxID=4109 RepID=A0A9J6AVS8_SOLCO|nr:hypothetical protein H5410_000317 [Solanum commersonii]
MKDMPLPGLLHCLPSADQALALLKFKNVFTIDPHASDYCYDISVGQVIQSYPRTLLWNKSMDCCSRDGVHWDEMTGQVIELDLRIIPSEISHLSKLHVLRISGLNELSLGPHNFELLLKNLTQLRDLNHYSVNISSTIPLNLSSHLTTLRLLYTQLRGVLPERVFHLSNLESLDLSSNPQLTLKPLWNLTNIESLLLGGNHLEGPISHFSIFEKLKRLSLRNNNFDGGLEFLSFNRSWTQLEWLDFSSNSLTGPIPSNQDQEEEDEGSPMINWQADGCEIGTQNDYENEKAQEKILVCSDLQDSSLLSYWDAIARVFVYQYGIESMKNMPCMNSCTVFHQNRLARAGALSKALYSE